MACVPGNGAEWSAGSITKEQLMYRSKYRLFAARGIVCVLALWATESSGADKQTGGGGASAPGFYAGFDGYARAVTTDSAEAQRWFDQARKADPKDPSVPYQLARIALGFEKEGAPSDPARALLLAEEASKLAGGKSPQFLELVAVCQFAGGDSSAAQRTINKILKLVEDDDERAYYEELAKELR